MRFIFLFCFISTNFLFAQTKQDSLIQDQVYLIVEKMPEFVGDADALLKFVANRITYPQHEMENGIEGTVYVTFVVDTTGAVTKVEVLRGVVAALDNEAIRVIKMFPKFKPGSQNGKLVRVRLNIPVKFKLNDTNSAPQLTSTDELYNKGVKALELGDYNEAIKCFDKSLALNEMDLDSIYNRGIAYFKLGDRENACKDWAKASSMGDKASNDLMNSKCK